MSECIIYALPSGIHIVLKNAFAMLSTPFLYRKIFSKSLFISQLCVLFLTILCFVFTTENIVLHVLDFLLSFFYSPTLVCQGPEI